MRACTIDTLEIPSSGRIYAPEDGIGSSSKGNITGTIRLKYALDGGSNSGYNPQVLRRDQLPLVLSVPEREGYNFAGWYTDSSYRNKITEINEDNAANMVLFAKWTKAIDNHYNVEMYSYKSWYSDGQVEKVLRSCSYGFLEHVNIPGMPATREKDYLDNVISSEAQCLQGLCFTPDYILMTSYTEESGKQGALMIFERETGRFLKSLDMKESSHLGGIAFDGDNVWICHSDSNTLERIPYKFIVGAIAENDNMLDMSSASKEYALKNIPSCLTFYDGKIWVATHTLLLESEMIAYSYNSASDSLTALSSYHIPSKVQGIAFDTRGAVYLSTSYGRNNSSYLMLYSSLEEMNQTPQEPAVRVEMPPCSEEIAIVDSNAYVLFESASMKYFEGTDGKGKSASPIDKVLEINVASMW
ncbi:MAG: InlB B-repeat-containing protein [Roseburia sp.]|nr:InlB B-repeat-containing protein [Roseburia sp.]